MVFVNRPGISDAVHEITTREIVDDIRRAHPQHPKMASIERIAKTVGVNRRRFVRPLHDVARTEPFEARNGRAYADVCDLAERAARRALDEAGMGPEDIATLITFHATGLAIPGLDAHLVNALRLPQTIQRVPMTQLACAGGAHALCLAAALARPGRPVLVAGAEALSSVYQHTDSDLPSMIWKMLFGDGGAAAVVSTEPLKAPGLVIEDTWTYLHQDDGQASTHYYRLRADHHGYHFDSTPAAVRAVERIIPHVPWGKQDGWAPAFGIIHPGSPKILDLIAAADGCPDDALYHSRSCLEQDGNVGGTAVLRVLARTHEDPPAPRTPGLLFGVGPGFAAAAAKARWSDA